MSIQSLIESSKSIEEITEAFTESRTIELDYHYLIQSTINDPEIGTKEQAVLVLTSLFTNFYSFCNKFGIKTSFNKSIVRNVERMISGKAPIELVECPSGSLDKLFHFCNNYNIKYNFK